MIVLTSLHHVLISFSIYISVGMCNKPSIAIIGGGVGGTVAAYEISEMCRKSNPPLDINIDLYEPNEVGGRLATKLINNLEFETGGSIIHNQNKYMREYTSKFGFKHKSSENEKVKAVSGFFNGVEFVFVESEYSIFTYLKLFWRYGRSLIDIGSKFVDPLLKSFSRIYEFQTNEKVFNNLHKFFDALSVDPHSYLEITTGKKLIEMSFGKTFVDDIAFIATNVNYNQDVKNIHAFAGAVALAGAQDELWSVDGGNKKVPEALLQHSEAKLIKKKVQSVTFTNNSKYVLEIYNQSYVYDYLILACPQIKNSVDNVKLEGFAEPIDVAINYQRTVATLVHGELNYTYFDYQSANPPNQIFSVNPNLFFSSVSMLFPVTYDKNYDGKVFKVFSKKPLTTDQLNILFSVHHNVTVVDWLAYPLYDTTSWNKSFVLNENLFYVNAIEWAASAMEMSAISGRNIALHIINKIRKQRNGSAFNGKVKI